MTVQRDGSRGAGPVHQSRLRVSGGRASTGSPPTRPSPACTQTEAPEGTIIISAARADEEELRLLDDTLRQDVPGVDGWKWDPGDFAVETYDSGGFNPDTYLVAADVASGDYIGLVRVWDNPGAPRLGLVGVVRGYRRRGLARVLLARAFRVLHENGKPEAGAEADDMNEASVTLLTSLGARRTVGILELIRPRSSPTRAVLARPGTRRPRTPARAGRSAHGPGTATP